MREVCSSDQDKIIPDCKVVELLMTVLNTLDNNDAQSPESKRNSTEVMYNALGYEIKRLDSTVRGAGRGVFVTRGKITAGSLVALYPGTMYNFCLCFELLAHFAFPVGMVFHSRHKISGRSKTLLKQLIP